VDGVKADKAGGSVGSRLKLCSGTEVRGIVSLSIAACIMGGGSELGADIALERVGRRHFSLQGNDEEDCIFS